MRKITQRKKGTVLWWTGCGILILALVGFTIFKSGLFNIKNVQVEARDLDWVNEEELKEASLIYGQNLLLVDQELIRENIKGKFICVQDISLTKFLPDKVKIEVLGRRGVVTIFPLKAQEATSSAFLENIATPSAEFSSETFLVDGEGVIFSKVGDLNITRIFLYDPDLKLGKKLDKSGQNSLWILEKLKELGFNDLTTQILDNFFLIYPSPSNPKIIFKLGEAMEAQIASLQLILEKAKIDAESLEFIDLRFDKPILRIAPKN